MTANNDPNTPVQVTVHFRYPNGNVGGETYTVTAEVQTKMAEHFRKHLSGGARSASYPVKDKTGSDRLLTIDFGQVHYIC